MLGEIQWLYSTIVDRCPAMPTSEMGQKLTWMERPFQAQSGRSASAVLLSPAARDDIAIQGGVATCPIAP